MIYAISRQRDREVLLEFSNWAERDDYIDNGGNAYVITEGWARQWVLDGKEHETGLMRKQRETEMKPFSTYPEDRQKLLSLAEHVLDANQPLDDNKAVELADLVKAILTDEAADDFDAELDAADLMKIEEGWQNFKAAGPVARVINDNQPGNTAIIEILRSPPTLGVGTELFAAESRP